MTTDTHRRNTQELTERAGTNDARQAGAIERNELPSLSDAVVQRAYDLIDAGLIDEARAFIAKHREG